MEVSIIKSALLAYATKNASARIEEQDAFNNILEKILITTN